MRMLYFGGMIFSIEPSNVHALYTNDVHSIYILSRFTNLLVHNANKIKKIETEIPYQSRNT